MTLPSKSSLPSIPSHDHLGASSSNEISPIPTEPTSKNEKTHTIVSRFKLKPNPEKSYQSRRQERKETIRLRTLSQPFTWIDKVQCRSQKAGRPPRGGCIARIKGKSYAWLETKKNRKNKEKSDRRWLREFIPSTGDPIHGSAFLREKTKQFSREKFFDGTKATTLSKFYFHWKIRIKQLFFVSGLQIIRGFTVRMTKVIKRIHETEKTNNTYIVTYVSQPSHAHKAKAI